jgi:hypothetical protein
VSISLWDPGMYFRTHFVVVVQPEDSRRLGRDGLVTRRSSQEGPEQGVNHIIRATAASTRLLTSTCGCSARKSPM